MNKTPKLRFKEFSGDWESKKLGDITKLTDGVHFTPTYVESGIPFWSVETIVSNANPKFITKEAHNDAIKRCCPQVNDILLTRIGTLAKPKLIDWKEEFSIYVSLALIKASDNYNSKFARYYFETEYYQKDFLSKSLLTATPKKINMEDLKQTKINLPSKEEQEKIASFFSLIDDKISLQSDKIEGLKDYKKGMMQKIFSRELRFKDNEGNDYPEWEEKKLGNYIVEYKEKTTENNQYPPLTSSRKGLFLQSDYFDKQIASTDNTGYNIVPRNYFTYRHMSDDAMFFFNINNLVDNGIVSTLYPVFTTNDKLDSIFLRYYLNETNEFKKYSLLQKQGGSRTYMYLSKLKEFKIKIPNIYEQNKIVKLLVSLESKLEKEQEKLASLNEYKKGLLQQMFV